MVVDVAAMGCWQDLTLTIEWLLKPERWDNLHGGSCCRFSSATVPKIYQEYMNFGLTFTECENCKYPHMMQEQDR